MRGNNLFPRKNKVCHPKNQKETTNQKYLKNEKGYEVHTVLINTGGFDEAELVAIEKRAYELGSAKHANLSILDKYYDKAIKYLIYGNVLKNNTYPLSVSEICWRYCNRSRKYRCWK